jgi:hypothetical protein
VSREGVPDNTCPPRNLPKDDPPTLIVRVVMQAVADLATARKLVGARIAYKKNARGEHVVALIFPSQPP